LDRDGWVTTAQGYKVDDNGQMPQAMLDLPWHYLTPGVWNFESNDIIAAAPMATAAQIRDGWQRVKNSGLKGIGGASQQFARLTNLRLDDDGIRRSTASRLKEFEPTIRQSFPGYDTMQADAQMAILNMAWGMGPAFVPAKGFHNFQAAMNANPPDFQTAAAESAFKPFDDQAVQEHNALSQTLLGNAARWQHSNVPASVLWWKPPGTPGANQMPTGGAMTTTAPSYTAPLAVAKKVGSIAGKVTLALLALGFGWVGLSAIRSHQRGEGWTTPIRRLGSRINRAEHRAETKIDAQVSHAIQAAEGKA
jgi:hypothetical protein